MKKATRSILLGCVTILLSLMISPALAEADEGGQIPRFEPADCPFTIPEGETIACGYLVVPENRARPNGHTIRIAVAIVKSHSPTPAPDPIIYLNGGPGGKAEEIINTLPQYDAWLAKRDLILFDQRGVGWSQPALDCPELHEVIIQQALGAKLTLEAQLAPRLACRDRWLKQGIDLTAYNSAEIAADVVDLSKILVADSPIEAKIPPSGELGGPTWGYEQVNLYGISYGTIPTQLIMRDYATTGHIRSVVLDAAVPLTVPTMADTPARLAASMDRLFEQCAADLLCRVTHPDLKTVYPQVIERLKTSPPTLSGTNPLNGDPFSFQYHADDFGYQIMYGSYRTFPGLIYDIYDGNYTNIIEGREQFISDLNKIETGDGFGLKTSINCNEPWQTISPEQRAAMAVYPEAAFIDNPVDAALCAQWPSFTPTDQTPLSSDIPTLVLIGEYDLRLSAYGEMIIERLSHGLYFLVPGALHNVLETGGPCPNLIALSFLDDPTNPPIVEDPREGSCLASTGSPHLDTRFIIRAAAVRRPVQAVLGLLSLLVVGLVVGASIKTYQHRSYGLRLSFAWGTTLRLAGWRPLVFSAGLLGFTVYIAQANLLPLNAVEAIGLVLPLIVALQAAFLCAASPEDEPILEVMLATPRPPAWTLLERLAMLYLLQGGVGTAASLYLAHATGESLTVIIICWLPLIFFLSGMAIYLTLATRRAIFGVLAVCLLWISLTLFGDFMVDRWPIAWPFHLYLQPDHAEYALNRLFITLLGLSLIGIAAARLLSDPERLLLGSRPLSRGAEVKFSHTPILSRSPAPLHRTPLHLHTPVQYAFKPLSSPSTVYINQLAAMIRYEFRLQWRRAALPALVVGLMITPVLGAFISQDDFRGYRAALTTGTLSLEVAKADITAAMLPVMWLGVFLIAVVMIPLVVADTIPKDQQVGVRELLDTLPLSPATYLAGKLFSLWFSLLAGLGLAAFIAGIVWWLMIGPFKLDLFLDLWFVGGMLLMFINAGLSTLLAAGQPTNRRAMMIGGAYSLLCLVGLGFMFSADMGWWRWLNPARPAVMLYYLLGISGAIQGNDELIRAAMAFVQQVASRGEVLRSLGAGLIQVGLVWLAAWQWLKLRRQ